MASETIFHPNPGGSGKGDEQEGCRNLRGWKHTYRAVDKEGDTIDFLLTAKRDKLAATRFLRQANSNNCTRSKINIDKRGSKTSVIKAYKDEAGTDIEIRQCKDLNNIVEQSPRFVKQKTRAALDSKAFHWAHATVLGVKSSG
jgi:putative transposase